MFKSICFATAMVALTLTMFKCFTIRSIDVYLSSNVINKKELRAKLRNTIGGLIAEDRIDKDKGVATLHGINVILGK